MYGAAFFCMESEPTHFGRRRSRSLLQDLKKGVAPQHCFEVCCFLSRNAGAGASFFGWSRSGFFGPAPGPTPTPTPTVNILFLQDPKYDYKYDYGYDYDYEDFDYYCMTMTTMMTSVVEPVQSWTCSGYRLRLPTLAPDSGSWLWLRLPAPDYNIF